MNTRDYSGEIAHLKNTLDELSLKRMKAAGGRAFLKIPELVMRRPLELRRTLGDDMARLDREFEKLHAQHSELSAESAKVEEEEGYRVNCRKCGSLNRSKFGREMDEVSYRMMGSGDPLAVSGWICNSCWEPVMVRVQEIAMWQAAAVEVTRQQYIPGYRTVADRGWICTDAEYDSEQEVKEALLLKAARMQANACVFYSKTEARDRVVAGYGAKGNPYYRTEVSYSGKARAVVVEPKPVLEGHQSSRRRS